MRRFAGVTGMQIQLRCQATRRESIANALAASLRRSYRKITTPETFETSLAALNEELGKLTSQGKTHWIGKLNALVAVKDGARFSIASTGKVTALLYRDDDFNNITEPSPTTNVLKTFENFSVGKLDLGDIIILSTNQLFINISAFVAKFYSPFVSIIASTCSSVRGTP